MPEVSGDSAPSERAQDLEEVMRQRGEDLVAYLNKSEAEGGPGPTTDDETARPSPFKNLPGAKTDPEKVE